MPQANASGGGCCESLLRRANNEECLVFSGIEYRTTRHDRRLSQPLCRSIRPCDQTRTSALGKNGAQPLYWFGSCRLRRNAVEKLLHFEVARAGFMLAGISVKVFTCRVANRHGAVAMRTAIENVTGNDVGQAHDGMVGACTESSP